jgi:hypothetical protein
MVPDSFVCFWTIGQRNVVHWFGINADIGDPKPVAQKTVRRRMTPARDLKTRQAEESSSCSTWRPIFAKDFAAGWNKSIKLHRYNPQKA